jgi:hypothetical protein
MRDSEVGRVLVASLHQGIADVLPARLGFYESWLSAEGIRGGRIGIAPVSAVLSFLRREGAAYDVTMTRAGEYAAEWTVGSMPPFRRSFVMKTPAWLRRRLVLGIARRLVRESYNGNSAASRVHRGTATVNVRASIFCTVRQPVGHPLCGFYASAFARLLDLFGLPSHAEVVACRGAGSDVCTLTMAPNQLEHAH